MAYVRTVKTASGTIAVQIGYFSGQRGTLKAAAYGRLAAGQGELGDAQ